ncbi:MAG: tetratricopeptide repeat protein [Deltaproteobacteria bacterium]|jgi:CHAT domain-containing protein/tetratricopeptide (TPR) repeat protein|nr:tetratricopeptide repeat protein [Deltaproteobacteria bacterium]
MEPGYPRRIRSCKAACLAPAALAVIAALLAQGSLADEPGRQGSPDPIRSETPESGSVQGPDRPETLEEAVGQADAMSAVGDHAGARDIYSRVAEAMTRSLGPDNPETLLIKKRLARELDVLGDYPGYLDLCAQIADSKARTLGPDHPETLDAKHALAGAMLLSGHVAAARDLLVGLVDEQERKFGPDHISTLNSKGNLAVALNSLGDYAASRDLNTQIVQARERKQGPEHPQTLVAKNNLANVMTQLGDNSAARDMHAQILEARERTLGPDHPDTLTSRTNLAAALRGLGNFAAARDFDERVTDAWERMSGPDHPSTLQSKGYLAEDLRLLGDLAASRDLYVQVLDGRTRVLGPEHPNTLATGSVLGTVLINLGDYAAARDIYLQVTEAMERTVGADHPATLGTKNNLAIALGKLGDHSSAMEILAQVLAANERALGQDHPNTIGAKSNLAFELHALGRLAEARGMLGQISEAWARVAGPGHPSSIAAKINLSNSMNALGESPAARDLVLDALASATGSYGIESQLSMDAAWMMSKIFADMGDTDRAVFFLKISVHAAQMTRGRISRLARELRRSYLASVENRYRGLFSLLMTQSRDAEALAVLGLLKEEELADLEAASLPAPPADPADVGAPADTDGADADLFGGTRDEALWLEYGSAAARAFGLQSELMELLEKGEGGTLSPDETRRLDELPGLVGEARASFIEVCLGEGGSSAPPGQPDPGSWAATRLAGRQAALSGMGGGAVLLHAVSDVDRLWLVTVTPDSVTSRQSAVGREELAGLAGEFGRLVADPASDPKGTAAKLYDAVIRPAEADLEAAGARTLMLSLDGDLRYAPMAALWDGERWLAERYPTTLFTESTAARLGDQPGSAAVSVRAMGVTRAWPGFPALPGVARELAAVVRSPGSPDGALDGEIRLDADFDRAALAEGLASDAPVVHVASHFLLDPMSLENTVLLLGNGGKISLKEIGAGTDLDFRGLDLLTLSACDTASASRGGEGREVESLGEVVQRAGASAVLATLMPVDDSSTPELMREFYRLRYIEGKDKAEALRGAQMRVMRDSGTSLGSLPDAVQNANGSAVTDSRSLSAPGGSSSEAQAPGPDSPAAQAPGADFPAAQAPGADSPAAQAPGRDLQSTSNHERDTRGIALSALEAGAVGMPAITAPRWDGTGFSHPYFWAPFVVMGSWK